MTGTRAGPALEDAMAKNPFMDFDMQKLMGDMKMPGFDKLPSFDWDAAMALQKRNMEAMGQAGQLAAEGAQAILRRQGEILKSAMEEANRSIKSMVAEGSPEDRIARQAESLKAAFDQAVANYKELAEMANKANAEAFGVVSKRVSESLEEVKTVVAKTTKK